MGTARIANGCLHKHAIRALGRQETKPPCDRQQAIRHGADVRDAGGAVGGVQSPLLEAFETVDMTPTRGYRKNDDAWVEMYGAIVKRLVNYGRLAAPEATILFARLCDVVRLCGILFQASLTLREEPWIGGRVINRWYPPVPPAERVLAQPNVAMGREGAIDSRAR